MLPRSQRLTREEIEVVRKKGRRVHSDKCTVSYLFVAGAPKAAVVVSKKVAKLAVDRNATRRLAYALLRELLPLCKPVWLSIIAGKGFAELAHHDMRQELLAALKKANLLTVDAKTSAQDSHTEL